MELKVFESPGQEWDEFASRYTDLIFYQSVWSEVLRKGLGGQPLYFYLKEGGEILAGLPSVMLRFNLFKILYASIPYGHLIGEKSYYPAFLELLKDAFKKKGFDQVRFVESPFSESYPVESFRPISAKCTLLNLTGFNKERILDSYRSEVRRAVRKAQKQGLAIRRATTREEMDIFYHLYLSSMERNRAVAKYPLRWFYALYDFFIQKGYADILFAVKSKKEFAAGVVLIYSNSSFHYLHNGSIETFLEDRPNDLLVDYIIQKGVEEGKTTLDFMGSDQKDISLINFKEKWGSQSKNIYTYVEDLHFLRCKIWEMGKKLASTKLGSEFLRRFRD